MTYASALFNDPADTLKQAQLNKYQAIEELLNVSKNDRILEIGCGWGGFSEYIAISTGSKIVGLTLSKEQLEFANTVFSAKAAVHSDGKFMDDRI